MVCANGANGYEPIISSSPPVSLPILRLMLTDKLEDNTYSGSHPLLIRQVIS